MLLPHGSIIIVPTGTRYQTEGSVEAIGTVIQLYQPWWDSDDGRNHTEHIKLPDPRVNRMVRDAPVEK